MKYPSSSHEDVGTLDLVDDDFDCRKNFLEICGVDFAKILKILTNLLSKDINFITKDDALKAFNLIKDALI